MLAVLSVVKLEPLGNWGLFAEVICGALEEGEVAGLNGEDFGTGG